MRTKKKTFIYFVHVGFCHSNLNSVNLTSKLIDKLRVNYDLHLQICTKIPIDPIFSNWFFFTGSVKYKTFSKFKQLCSQERIKGSPFLLFWNIHFWLSDPKTFLKAPLAPEYTNFDGVARAEKARFFWPNFFKKCPKMPLLACFFKISNLPKIGSL